MSRDLPSGTPNRSSGYIRPGERRPVLKWSLVAAGLLTLTFVLLFVIGQRRFISPGTVSAVHAPIDTRCAQCHDVGRAVAELRCERCHDPSGSDRLMHSAHVLLGNGDPAKATAAETVKCVSCHTEHHGRDYSVRKVDDRECGVCHLFSTFGRHPEFSMIRANIATGIGLRFDHDRHLIEVGKTNGQRCEACHEPSRDLIGFEPVRFDAHCASCHTKNGFVTGETDPISPDFLVTAAQFSASPSALPVLTVAARGKVVASNLRHRDEWVLYNARRLRRTIDPEGETAERTALRAQIDYLSRQLQARSFSMAGRDQLVSWLAAFQREVALVDKLLQARSDGESNTRALTETAQTVSQLTKSLAELGSDAADIQDAGAPLQRLAPPGTSESADTAQKRFEARRAELLQILDAISRRGDKGLADRAAALRMRVTELRSSNVDGAPDAATLRVSLRRLDDILRAVRGVPDPEASLDAAQAAALRDVAQQRIANGLTASDFEGRRRELLSALDAVAARADGRQAGRIAVLRQEVIGMRPGTGGDEGLRQARAQALKTIDRLKIELELVKAGDTATPVMSAPERDRRLLQSTIDRLNQQLAAVEGGGRPGVAESPEQQAAATNNLISLLAPCLKCHVLEGARLAPVSAAQTVFRHANFTHKPHVEQVDCLTCHSAVTTSKLASDVVVPGVASCQQCHAPSKARSECAACHDYHPLSVASLVATR